VKKINSDIRNRCLEKIIMWHTSNPEKFDSFLRKRFGFNSLEQAKKEATETLRKIIQSYENLMKQTKES
jgi:hypothetical protein